VVRGKPPSNPGAAATEIRRLESRRHYTKCAKDLAVTETLLAVCRQADGIEPLADPLRAPDQGCLAGTPYRDLGAARSPKVGLDPTRAIRALK